MYIVRVIYCAIGTTNKFQVRYKNRDNRDNNLNINDGVPLPLPK